MRTAGRLVLCMAFILLQGCWGPYFDPEEVTFPTISPSTSVTGVVVSDFYEGRHKISTTQSFDIVQLREAMEVRDISFDIAAGISQSGIPARAMVNGRAELLQPGELLVRGVVNPGGWKPQNTAAIVNWVCTFGTLCLYGMVTPYVYPGAFGPDISVRVQVIDHRGSILLSHEQVVVAFNQSLHFIAWLEGDTDEALLLLRPMIAKGIAKALPPP